MQVYQDKTFALPAASLTASGGSLVGSIPPGPAEKTLILFSLLLIKLDIGYSLELAPYSCGPCNALLNSVHSVQRLLPESL
jgi:hypothetical protein